MLPIIVHANDTLSGIAAQHGTTYQAIAAASGISNPNEIYVGETVYVPSGGSYTQYTPPAHHQSYSTSSGSSGSSGSLSDVPGMPSSLAGCIAFKESTNLQNPAANGNAYGIIPASGYNVYGTSLAHQKQVAGELYHQYGGKPWAADGCPGT